MAANIWTGWNNLTELDSAAKAPRHFTAAGAKYLANAMAYDDVIGVADLKTRSARFARISSEMNAGDAPIYFTEFMHPRAEEIAGLMPAGLGRMGFIEARLDESDRPPVQSRPPCANGQTWRLPAALCRVIAPPLPPQAVAPSRSRWPT